MLLPVTPAFAPPSPAFQCPPIPRLLQRPRFVQSALLASKDPPLSRFHVWPIPLPLEKGSMAQKRSGRVFFQPGPSRRIPSLCRRHQIPEHSAWEKHMRERSTFVGPSAAQVHKLENLRRGFGTPLIPHSFLDEDGPRHYPRRTFPQRATVAAETTIHAHPSARPCHCRRLPVRCDRAGDAFPPWPAKCQRLFSGRPHRAMVGAGVFDCRHGNLNTYHHRDAGDCLWRKPYLPSTSLRLSDWARGHRLVVASRPLSRSVFLLLRPSR